MSDYENFLISKTRFNRLMRKIMQQYFNDELKIQFIVLNALQKTVKTFLFLIFTNMCIILLHYYINVD